MVQYSTLKVKPYPTPSPVGEGRGEGKTAAPLSDDRSVIPDNRLKTYNGTTYYYDDLGNLIHRELADGEVQNYFYDLHDQLVKAEIFKKDGSKETWAYTYDALGRRIGKGRLKTDGSLEDEIRFVWDGSHLLQEIHPDGRYTYIYTDPDSYEPLAQVRDWTTKDGKKRQQTHYFHCDQIGIPREMTDKDGNLLWFGNYTGWGRLKEETKVTDSAYQPFRLQNQYADRETGLHYNFFRYYEPNVGRFVNQDPIGLAGGENLYAFSPNTQVWVDWFGLMIVYRALKQSEIADVKAGKGISRPTPAHRTTPTQHVSGTKHAKDPWISTTRCKKTAKDKYGANGSPVVKIDTNKIPNPKDNVLDLSTPEKAASLGTPFARNAAAADAEVLIKGSVPANAIIGLI